MTNPPSAKRLTFIYFSIVAFSVILIHTSVFEMTMEDMEHIYAEKRLSSIEGYISENWDELKKIPERDNTLEVELYKIVGLYDNPLIFLAGAELPEGFPDINRMALGEDIEVKPGPFRDAYFVRKIAVTVNNQDAFALLVINNNLYESSEEQLLPAHLKQILISFVLLAVSLWVVLKISDRLTRPIAAFADALSKRSSTDLTPVALSQQGCTRELQQMLETFNAYQARINELLERERAFNRYTSHELRSPLMVMQGAITLLGESREEAFIEKQRGRLQKATSEMSEFIETLLTLTRAVDDADLHPRAISQTDLESIIQNQQHLLRNKAVSWTLDLQYPLVIHMPEAAFHILLGNIIKNAFAWTEQGEVRVKVTQTGIDVIDSGPGLSNSAAGPEGFGLGLLLVRDICHRYGWQFELMENRDKGCCATVRFDTAGSPG